MTQEIVDSMDERWKHKNENIESCESINKSTRKKTVVVQENRWDNNVKISSNVITNMFD